MFKFIKKLFDSNEKQLKEAEPVVVEVAGLKDSIRKMSFEDMNEKALKFRKELQPLLEKVPEKAKSSIQTRNYEEPLPDYEMVIIEKLQEFMPQVFGMIREIAHRKYNRWHHDVQILAGTILAQGNKLIEVQTGEGKTQIFHLPTALYALTGRGVHVITVNDYLARRDAEYAGHIFSELGLSVGVILPSKSYKFVPDGQLKEVKGEEVYKERMEVELVNPNDVRGWNLVECDKKDAYACDIVYGTNNEFGFDYLRDNMVSSVEQIVQRELYYCIIDEVDSVLIDEARTPLIISAPAAKSNELYVQFANLVPRLEAEKDYTVEEKSHSAVLTDEGIDKVEKMLGLKNLWEDSRYAHHLENALKAHTLYKRDDEYLVKDGQVMIVDQFTGRVLPGRRYSEGLHQAIEAKEGVEIKQESKTLATITFQNYFRLYKLLGGGSGTVMTEAEEFYKIYNLESVSIPTNKPVIRKDLTDQIYKDQEAKFRAVVSEIIQKNEKGQPVLVGTTSIENSELISRLLEKQGVEHEVLNAKQHEREAQIVANAGEKAAVTIATNMAGRGTDIRLGDGVKKLGGLHIIGTERHDARRVDNQLRGRSGRQGDPGSSRFFVALDDEIMRMQGGSFIQSFMERTKIPDDMPIESGLVGNAIERAQKRMEGYHFDIRNNVVKYDDVMNQQREIFYTRRRKILRLASVAEKPITDETNQSEKDEITKKRKQLRGRFTELIQDEVESIVGIHFVEGKKRELEKITDDFLDFGDDAIILGALVTVAGRREDVMLDAKEVEENEPKVHLIKVLRGRKQEDIIKLLSEIAMQMVETKEAELGEVEFLHVAKLVLLQAMDQLWTDHLDAMQDLREGIGLRGVAQRDPLVEYKNEALHYFDNFIASSKSRFTRRIFKVRRVQEQQQRIGVRTNVDQIEDVLTGDREMVNAVRKYLTTKRESENVAASQKQKKKKPQTVVKGRKIGRNDPCPCGSGKKYKKCHGR